LSQVKLYVAALPLTRDYAGLIQRGSCVTSGALPRVFRTAVLLHLGGSPEPLFGRSHADGPGEISKRGGMLLGHRRQHSPGYRSELNGERLPEGGCKRSATCEVCGPAALSRRDFFLRPKIFGLQTLSRNSKAESFQRSATGLRPRQAYLFSLHTWGGGGQKLPGCNRGPVGKQHKLSPLFPKSLFGAADAARKFVAKFEVGG
jgi:hypothetical protein